MMGLCKRRKGCRRNILGPIMAWVTSYVLHYTKIIMSFVIKSFVATTQNNVHEAADHNIKEECILV